MTTDDHGQPDRERARELCRRSLEAGDALGWFERLYAEAERGAAVVPWANRHPDPQLVAWLEGRPAGGRALVVGCGLGDDAAELARRGWRTVGFDLSATAVRECERRFSADGLEFVVADLLDAPPEWRAGFDLVVESCTLQALPPEPRAAAGRALATFLRPGGQLLVIARAREEGEPPGEMPWPLTRAEVEGLGVRGLECVELRDFYDDEEPPVRRFRATFRALGRTADAT